MTYNVVCLKHGDKYNAEYVNKLYRAVKRNTTLKFKFHCFTENEEGIHEDIFIHKLPHFNNVHGWWYKLYFFSKDIKINGRILFLDLDTLIVGNIDHYLKYDSGFVVLRDLWARGNNVGSAIMSFEVGKHTQIWETFIKDPFGEMKKIHPHGDQKIIQAYEPNRKYWQDIFPNEIVSFKSDCRGGLPKNAKIVCFHGKPSIPEAINKTTMVQGFVINPTPWIKEYWK